MMQKDQLKQDMFIIGPPGMCCERECVLCERETAAKRRRQIETDRQSSHLKRYETESVYCK